MKKKKPGTSKRAEATYRSLINAAAEVVGEEGYEGASIAKITGRAGLGQGTFYRHFSSRQELFNILLPLKGKELLDHLQEAARGAHSLVEVEIRAYKAFFLWVKDNPWFFRVLHDAHIGAPEAYRIHINQILVRYRKSLKRSWDQGELKGFREDELDSVAFLLMSMRDYIYSEYIATKEVDEKVVDKIIETYRKFIEFGLSGMRQDKIT